MLNEIQAIMNDESKKDACKKSIQCPIDAYSLQTFKYSYNRTDEYAFMGPVTIRLYRKATSYAQRNSNMEFCVKVKTVRKK